MQQIEDSNGFGAQRELESQEQGRIKAVVETLAAAHASGDTLAEIAHETRNMVAALALYCDLLEEPGVLTPRFRHYGAELRLIAAASRRMVEKLTALEGRNNPANQVETARDAERAGMCAIEPATPIEDLAAEVLANRNLLSALAGPAATCTVDAVGGAKPVQLSTESLTQILVNLVKNAAEAVSPGGHIAVRLREGEAGAGESLLLTVEDDGPGIPAGIIERIFDSGYSTRQGNSQSEHRGLGLAIVRSMIEKAGGRIAAENLSPTGARFSIELPVRTH